MSYIKQFHNPETNKYELDGCEESDPLDFIHVNLLNHCGCGLPMDSLKYLRDALAWIHEKSNFIDLEGQEWDDAIKLWWAKRDSIFYNEGIFYFTMYVLETLDLEEHGGSTPGWLTTKGEGLLEDLNAHLPKEEEPVTSTDAVSE